MRTAVVGHVEFVEFASVERVPAPGEIVTARRDWSEPAGGGAVAAVQLVRLAGQCTFYTALGDDEIGERARAGLERLGVRVEAAIREGEPTRRAFTFVDDAGERTITVIGARLQPERDDPLPWDELRDTDAVYFTAGGPDALRAAREARVLVATARVIEPRFVVTTDGAHGGHWVGAEGRSGEWAAAPVPGPVADAYGCGDSFAAGLAYALGEGQEIDDALELAARCGAECLAGHGPYQRQLTLR